MSRAIPRSDAPQRTISRPTPPGSAIETIAANPYGSHPNATRLRDRDGGFRLRIGDWRVIYFLDNERKVLLVVKIDRRGRVYR